MFTLVLAELRWLDPEAFDARHSDVVVLLMVENRMLRKRLRAAQPGKRLLLTVDERRMLGLLAARVGRKALNGLELTFSPETLLRWYPTRKRELRWSEFLKPHRQAIAAADFFTVEVITCLAWWGAMCCSQFAWQAGTSTSQGSCVSLMAPGWSRMRAIGRILLMGFCGKSGS